MKLRSVVVFALVCAGLSIPLAIAAVQAVHYRLAKKVVLGGDGGWDYFDVDPTSGHVFIPRGSHILVVDDQLKQVGDIRGVDGAHAISFAPELNRAFLSTEASVSILDLQKMGIAGTIALPGKDPDAILYDKFSNRVFTFNGGGSQDASAVDVATRRVAGTVALGGKPEFAQTDAQGHIFVNIEDKSEIVEFDAKTLGISHRWPLAPCQAPSGLAIDVAHKRLYAGCRNRSMAVVDYTNGKVLTTLPIWPGTDASRFDPQTGLAFASCGGGVISVVGETAPGQFSVVQTITTSAGARTMALDSKTHSLYTVTAQMAPPPAPTAQNPHPYPQPIAGTFAALSFSFEAK